MSASYFYIKDKYGELPDWFDGEIPEGYEEDEEDEEDEA